MSPKTLVLAGYPFDILRGMASSSDWSKTIENYTAAMQAIGIPRRKAAPWVFRAAWALGLHVRPALYQSYWQLVLTCTTLWALLTGPLVVLDIRLHPVRDAERLYLIAVLCSLLWSLMAAFFAVQHRKRLALPDWESFKPPHLTT